MTDAARLAPPHLIAYLDRHGLDAEFLAPGVPMPTVPEAAAAIGAPPEQILKTILFTSGEAFVVAITNGAARVDRTLLAEASGLPRPRVASPDVVLSVTGYPAGGVAPLGLPVDLTVIVDVRTAALPMAYGGGGHTDLLLRVVPADVIRLNQASVHRIVAST